MRRRLNLKALLFLLLLVGLLTAGGYFLHRFQVRSNANALLLQANQARDTRQGLSQSGLNATDHAAEELKLLHREIDFLRRYLGFIPTELDELARYGLLLADEQIATTPLARFRAMTVLDRVLAQYPDRDTLRRKVVDLAMSIGRFSDAHQHLLHWVDEERSTHPDKNNPELIGLLGECEEAAGKGREARKAYERALKQRGAGVETYYRLASLLQREKRAFALGKITVRDLNALADKHIADMVKAHPANYKAYLHRASYLRAFDRISDTEKRLAAIESDVEAARKLAPEEPEVLLALADVARLRRSPDRARALLERGLVKHPKQARLYLVLSELEAQAGRLDRATEVLTQGLERLPEKLELLWALATLYVQRNAATEARATIDRLQKAGVGPAERGYLVARLLLTDKKLEEAAEVLDESLAGLLGQLGRSRNAFTRDLAREVGLLLGDCRERLSDPDTAYDAYQKVFDLIEPGSLVAKWGMARSRQAAGQIEAALSEYRGLALLPGAPSIARIERARLTFQRNLLRETPNWAEVDLALQLAEEVPPVPVGVVLLRLEMLIQQKQLSEAVHHLNTVVLSAIFAEGMRHPFQAPVTPPTGAVPLFFYTARADLSDAAGDSDMAVRALARAAEVHGPSQSLRLARLRHLTRQQTSDGAATPKVAEGLAQLEREAQQAPKEQRRALLQALAEAHGRLKAPAHAERLWKQIARDWPNDLLSRLTLFEAAFSEGNAAQLKALIEQMRTIEGKRGLMWRSCEVRRLIRQATVEQGSEQTATLRQAKALLAEMRARRKDWSRVLVAEAHIADLEGQSRTALAKYREAIQRGDRSLGTLQRTFVLSVALGDVVEAQRLLRQLPEATLTGEIGQAAAALHLGSHDSATALRLAERDAQASTDYRSHLWLASLRYRVARTTQDEKARQALLDQAEAAYRKAVELGKTSPQPWVALVVFLAATEPGEKKDKARQALADAERLLKGNSAALLPLALGHETVGAVDIAANRYNEVLRLRPDDPATLRAVAEHYLRQGRIQQAEGLMQRLVRDFQGRAPADAAWARRALAWITARGGSYQQTQAALAGLGSANGLPRDADAKAIGDQRARASILAMQQGRQNRAQAIALLRNLIDEKKHTAQDHFLLAVLYEKDGNWPAARTQLLAAEGRFGPRAAPVLAHHARILVSRNDDLTEAEAVLGRLRKLLPRAFITDELTARLRHKEKKTEEAVQLLQAALKREENLTNVQLAAAAFEEMGRKEDAEKLFYRAAELAAKNPRAIGMLIAFHARHKEAKKALDLCEKAWKTNTPADAVNFCMTVVTALPQDAEVLKRLDEQITKARADRPGQAVLTTALGHIRAMQANYSEAEKLYEEALKATPGDILALNNLAWLLSTDSSKAARTIQLTESAIREVGPFPFLLDTQALALLTLNRPAEALRLLEEAVKEDPTPASHFRLARAYLMTKNTVRAKAELAKAVKGLKLGELHPQERPIFARMCKDLGVQPPS